MRYPIFTEKFYKLARQNSTTSLSQANCDRNVKLLRYNRCPRRREIVSFAFMLLDSLESMNTSVCQRPLAQLETSLRQVLQAQAVDFEDLELRCAVRRQVLMILAQHPAYAVADPELLLDDLAAAATHLPLSLIQTCVTATDALDDAEEPDQAASSTPRSPFMDGVPTLSGEIEDFYPPYPPSASQSDSQSDAPTQLTQSSDRSSQPESGAIPLQFFLRTTDQTRPYQTRRYWLIPSTESISDPQSEEPDLERIFEEAEFRLKRVEPVTANSATPDQTAGHTDDADQADNADDPEPADQSFAIAPYTATNQTGLAEVSEDALSPEMAASESATDPNPETARPPGWLATLESWPIGILASGVVGVLAFTGAFYALTRPCVIGGCSTLTDAEALSQTALGELTEDPTAQTVQLVHSDIQKADRLLESIPFWSRYHSQAQDLRASYQTQAQELDQIMSAQRFATLAAEQSQNPPHPVSQWQDIRNLWSRAIAELDKIPANSDLNLFIDRKREEYQSNLSAIDQRITADQQAENQFNLAVSAAEAAQLSESTADSLLDRKALVTDWQQVVNHLNRIPQGTLVHSEAQQLLQAYEQKLSEAKVRYTQEQLSVDAYERANRHANSARNYEQQNQWTMAVTTWRQALSNIRQVPESTANYEDAQTLIGTYRTALEKAEGQLRSAISRQKVAQDLQKACAGSPTICTYTITPDLIEVRLTAEYDRSVQDSMVNAALLGDAAKQAQIRQHVDSLLRALTVIGQNAGISLQLYDARGASLGRYTPGM